MLKVDYSKHTTSWTKYDIVQVMDSISSVEKIESYKAKEIVINEAILRSFLGINHLNDPIPNYWIEIQNHPLEKKLFSLFAVLFTHGGIIKMFANLFSNLEWGGVFITKATKEFTNIKVFTNIRSALVESGAALPNYRRKIEVPYDFSLVFKNDKVGKLFKQLLKDRLSKILKSTDIDDDDFYSICYDNKFDSAIGLKPQEFKAWLEGIPLLVFNREGSYIKNAEINDFYSIKHLELNFGNSKEIYFLGENGDGKSLVLMSLFLTFKANFILKLSDLERVAKARMVLEENPRFLPLGRDNEGKRYGIGDNSYLQNVFAYGAHRSLLRKDSVDEFGFMSLFDPVESLIDPESWLSLQRAIELERASNNSEGFSDSEGPLTISVDALEKLLNEILERNVTVKVSVKKVEFIEKGANVLRFDQLSEGYKSVILFVCDLIFRLSKSAKKGQSIEDLEGVVIVDEIDLHLHPNWQFVIVKKLREMFPKVQFVFSTHSPAIIQGASDSSLLFRVYRDSDTGETKVSESIYRKDLNNLMINSLVTHPVFGMETARLSPQLGDSDTSDDYVQYRINLEIRSELDRKKKEGTSFISDIEIHEIIQRAIKSKLGDDKNK